jgi:hypothetical protein
MGRGKRTSHPRPSPAPALASQGRAIFSQDFASSPSAGYDLSRDWAFKVTINSAMAALIVDLRRAYPQLVGKLPCVADGCACFSNEKARWFYHNRPGELKWEHETASEYILHPAFHCWVQAVERQDVLRAWYRYPDGRQFYKEDDEDVLAVLPDGTVKTSDGWTRYRTKQGEPCGSPTDTHEDGTKEWRSVCSSKPISLPALHPLHRVDGPAVIHPDGSTENWQRGKKL